MDFISIFEKIDTAARDKVEREIKIMVKNDKTFLKLKKKAKKSSDEVPDFLDYVYNVYMKKIDKLSSQYNIDYDEIAQMFIGM